ncbi:hypothetical protein C0585_01105 [Candidatus Woesearchaeota archaeon]|nr:MAG: hypothetical protein C0585_01105 [Candidatus Woesearchaeota archaeon]
MKLKEFNANLKPQSYSSGFGHNKNIINKLLLGNYLSDVKRRGFEFLDYRVYDVTDDASKIDWKASKKAQKLLVKETIEEKAVNVVFIVDVSDSMICASHPKLKSEYVAELVCNIAFAVQREGNAIGLVMFNEKVMVQIPPSIGMKQYHNMMKELQKPSNYGGGCDIKKALRESIEIFKIPSLVILISDFLSVEKGWEDYLKIISMKFRLLGVMIRDPRDRALPKDTGYFVLEDPSSKEKIIVDTKQYHKKFDEYVKKNEEYIRDSFKRAKSSVLELSSDTEFFNPLIKFLEKQSKVIAK